MKTILVLTVALVGAVSASAQGLINFNTKAGNQTTASPGAVWVPVFLPEPECPDFIKQGTPAFLGGTQTYTGGFVMGSGFTAQLWSGPAGSREEDLQVVATTTFRTQTATTVAGTVAPPIVSPSVPGVPVGQMATFQLRAWDNSGGTITSWADVFDPVHNIVTSENHNSSPRPSHWAMA